jgi:hypothetical protein
MKIKTLLTLTLFSALVSCTKEEDNSNKDIRTDFLGTWKCTQTSKLNGSSQFTVNIKSDDNNASRINMFNFYNIGSVDSIYADVSTTAANSLSIPKQTHSSDDIIGSGNDVSTTKLTFDYTVDDGNAVDTITAIFNKIQ